MNLSHNGTKETINVVFKNLERVNRDTYISLKESGTEINNDFYRQGILNRILQNNIASVIMELKDE